jgi:hypothetical protein
LTGVYDTPALMPAAFALAEAYPNPFNPSTVVQYDLPVASPVRLAVYDVLGREVRVLVNGWLDAGRHRAVLDAGALSSGVYIFRIEAGRFTATKRCLCVK